MNIIFMIHLVFFIGYSIVPFTNNRENSRILLDGYSIHFLPLVVNDDTCALTQAEMMVTGKHKDETFMGRLVGPIYKMEENQINNMTKTMFFVLWAFVQYRLGHFDLFFEDVKEILKGKKVK